MNLKIVVVFILIIGVCFALIGFGIVDSTVLSSVTTMVKGESPMAGLASSSWPMAGHDRQLTCQAGVKGPQTNNTKWTFEIGGWIASSASVAADGTIYIMGTDKKNNSVFNESELYNRSVGGAILPTYVLYAINPDGSLKWKTNFSMDITIFKAAPLVAADGTIYITTQLGELYAINPDGSLRWIHKAEASGCGKSGPNIGSDGTVYYVWGNRLYAVGPNGTRKWMTDPDEIVVNSNENQLAIGPDGTIYCQSLGRDVTLYAVDNNGKMKWQYGTGGAHSSSPSIGSDGTIYLFSNSLKSSSTDVVALKSNGDEKWSVVIPDSSPDICGVPAALGPDGTIYIPTGEHIVALKSDGSLKWEYSPEIGRSTSSTMAVDKDGTLYYYSHTDRVFALTSDGKLKWQYEIDNGSDGFPPVIGPDGTIYANSEITRYLYAIGP
jgi:hypothetical protein